MKPAPFDYVRVTSVDDACRLLASDDEARLISGGQTLIPMMAMRLARPTQLIDIGRLTNLSGIADKGDAVHIGATTKQIMAERSALVGEKLPLLAKVMPWVGHTPTRSRGTFGGTVANADPAAEIPLVLATLGGQIVTRNTDGETVSPAGDFFIGPMTTIAGFSDCITELRFPVWKAAKVGVGFHEISSRRSDFALVAAAAQISVDDAGNCTGCVAGVGGATPFPMALAPISDALRGSDLSDTAIDDAVKAGLEGIELMSDPHATPSYRKRAAHRLLTLALKDARAQATGAAR